MLKLAALHTGSGLLALAGVAAAAIAVFQTRKLTGPGSAATPAAPGALGPVNLAPPGSAANPQLNPGGTVPIFASDANGTAAAPAGIQATPASAQAQLNAIQNAMAASQMQGWPRYR